MLDYWDQLLEVSFETLPRMYNTPFLGGASKSCETTKKDQKTKQNAKTKHLTESLKTMTWCTWPMLVSHWDTHHDSSSPYRLPEITSPKKIQTLVPAHQLPYLWESNPEGSKHQKQSFAMPKPVWACWAGAFQARGWDHQIARAIGCFFLFNFPIIRGAVFF